MSSAAKVGAVMLAALIALAIFILKIERIEVAGGQPRVLSATLPSVSGLDRKAAVRIAGVRVGQVTAMALDASNQAVLTMALEPGVLLHEGSSIRIASLGMLGDKHIEIIPGPLDAPMLAEGAVLSGQVPPSMDELFSQISDIAGDVKEVTSALRQSLGGAEGAAKINEIVDNVAELSASLRSMVEANRAAIDDTVGSFHSFSADLETEIPVLTEKLGEIADSLALVIAENREDLRGSMGNIRELSDKLQTSTDNLNRITTKIADGEGTLGKLVNDETTVDNLNETMDDISSGVTALKDTVGRFNRFRMDVLLAAETLPDVDGSRTRGGFDLWTSDSRFLRVQLVNPPFGKERSFIEETTIEYPDGSIETTTTTINKRDGGGTVSAQIGWKLFDKTTIRAGLIESHGGVGIDHRIELKRPIELIFEAYHFDRDQIDDNPHLRLEGRYYLNPNLFLSAGWDDFASDERSSILFGGGVTWRDDDFKYLLGLAGSGL